MLPTKSERSIVAVRHARRRRGGRSREKEPALKRSFIALVGLLVAAAVVAAPTAGAPVQTPKRGGTVVYGLDGEPTCINPVTCGLYIFTRKVLTPAFALRPDLTSEPQLVSRVTFTRKLPYTLTYTIRPEARWSDRVPVTARDFVFTHEAIEKARAAEPDGISSYHDIHGRVQSIRELDAKSFRVVLRSREAGWRGLFTTVLPRHALRGENLESVWSDRIVNPKTGRPIGNGPFLLERWQRGKQYTLVRNPNYWGPHVSYLDRLIVRFQQRAGGTALPQELLEGLRDGQLDFAFSRDPSFVPELRRIAGIRVFKTTSDSWEHVDIRIRPGGHPALQGKDGKLVRRALAYGIDRVAIVRRLFADLDPTYPPSESTVNLTSHASYRPNWSAYRYRPDESRRLLARAGCQRGAADDVYVCAGRRLELRLMTTAGSSHRIRTIELVQTHLRRAGIAVELVFIPGVVLFQQILPSGDYDLAAYAQGVGFESSDRKRLFGCGGSVNYGGYCQRLVTKDLDQADRILEPEQRGRVLNRADVQLAKDVPRIPLYELPYVLALRKTVRDVVVSPEQFLWNAEDWWLDD
jgi:peptide/nickel transport system substrate-binding protein